jgi:hypothetical protein
MGVLDIQKRIRTSREIDEQFKYCQWCGKKMIDNTFQHGSRRGGSMNCPDSNCEFFIMF